MSGFWSDREVLHGVVGFDEAAEAFHHLGAVEEFAEEFDFLAEFLVGDGLDEFLGGHAGFGVELGDLPGHGAGDFERVAFSSEVRDEAGLVRSFRLDGAAGEEQIADEAVTDVAPKTRNAAEAGDETEAKLGKTEARHFVRDDQVAEKRELKSAAHAETVNGGEGDERCSIDCVGDFMDALDKLSEPGDAFLRRLLEFSQEQRADFVEGFVVESEFDNAIAPFPAEAFATKFFYGEKMAVFFLHALVPAATACLLYSWSISC